MFIEVVLIPFRQRMYAKRFPTVVSSPFSGLQFTGWKNLDLCDQDFFFLCSSSSLPPSLPLSLSPFLPQPPLKLLLQCVGLKTKQTMSMPGSLLLTDLFSESYWTALRLSFPMLERIIIPFNSQFSLNNFEPGQCLTTVAIVTMIKFCYYCPYYYFRSHGSLTFSAAVSDVLNQYSPCALSLP